MIFIYYFHYTYCTRVLFYTVRVALQRCRLEITHTWLVIPSYESTSVQRSNVVLPEGHQARHAVMTVEVQHRVRETALDFDVFLEDLKQWTREVQQKDKALRCLEFALDKKEECRTSAPASAKYIPVKVRARARLLLDNAEGEFENRDSSKHGTFLEELLKIGNGCFRKREYDSAILHYSRYIQTHRNSSAAFANRAMCHMNNKCWALAEVDCTYALEVDPNNVKVGQIFNWKTVSVSLKKLFMWSRHSIEEEVHGKNLGKSWKQRWTLNKHCGSGRTTSFFSTNDTEAD